MRSRLASLIAFPALGPVLAEAPRPSTAMLAAAPVPDEEAVRKIVADALTMAQAKDCRGAVAKLDPLALRLPAGKARQSVQLVRMTCLAAIGRGGEVIGVQRELEAAVPDQPLVRAYGIMLAMDAHAPDDAADRLAKFAEDDPANLILITTDGVRDLLRLLGDKNPARRDRLLIALARAEWHADDAPELSDSIAMGAMRALLARNAPDDARALLPRVQAPELLAEMATERVYAPLWPEIEERLGPASARAVDAFARDRLDAFARLPEDALSRRDAVRAFVLLRRLPEAAETARPVQVSEGISEQDAGAVRYAAEALASAGQAAGAIERLRPFTALDPKRSPEALPGVISLAELLDETGREQEALVTARAALSKGANALSPYGVAWLRRTEVCALSALGQAAEAKTAGDLLKAQAADNSAATIEGLLCAGRRDEAAVLALATLATPEGAEELADQFQPNGALWAPDDSRLRSMWTTLLARRPDVRAAFERRARILPKPLWPARSPRPIPVTPAASGEPTT